MQAMDADEEETPVLPSAPRTPRAEDQAEPETPHPDAALQAPGGREEVPVVNANAGGVHSAESWATN